MSELKDQEAELQKLEAEKEDVGKPEIPLIPFSLNFPQNGKTYPVMRKKHKGMKQVFVPETHLINSDVIKMYNQLVKQFNNMPQAVQSGFISELNRLINYIHKQQLEAEAITKLKVESVPVAMSQSEDPNQTKLPLDDNSGKAEEGNTVSINTDVPTTSDSAI
jgi:hypothetical protein